MSEKKIEDMVTEHNVRLLSIFSFAFGQVCPFIYSIRNMLIVLLFVCIHLSIQIEINYEHLGK